MTQRTKDGKFAKKADEIREWISSRALDDPAYKLLLQKFDEFIDIKDKDESLIKCEELIDMCEVLKLERAKVRKAEEEQFAKDFIKIIPLISRPRSAYEIEEVRKQREWDKEHHCHSVLVVSQLARKEWEEKRKRGDLK